MWFLHPHLITSDHNSISVWWWLAHLISQSPSQFIFCSSRVQSLLSTSSININLASAGGKSSHPLSFFQILVRSAIVSTQSRIVTIPQKQTRCKCSKQAMLIKFNYNGWYRRSWKKGLSYANRTRQSAQDVCQSRNGAMIWKCDMYNSGWLCWVLLSSCVWRSEKKNRRLWQDMIRKKEVVIVQPWS